MNLQRPCLFLLCLWTSAVAQAQRGDGGPADAARPLAANHVAVSERIHTSGQPDRETLAELGERGFELVVNLAPPTTADAVADEGRLVAGAGVAYVNIPVNWRQPTAADFDLFSAVMLAAHEMKVLVHCQINMRASAFTFLYRVAHEGVAPGVAFEGLSRVWVPDEHWGVFVNETLARHGIDYRLPATAPAGIRETAQ